jgi:hypothetical protein
MKEMLAAINPNSIPPTFRDAITTSRKLGYRYLWIDSLCIIQDSYDDWVSESNRMQSYYKESVLTIAASDADGDEQGFLVRRGNPTTLSSLYQPMKRQEGGYKHLTLKSHGSAPQVAT